MNKKENRGISMVIGSMLFTILIISVASALFIALYTYDLKGQEARKIEQERIQERIVLTKLETDNSTGVEYVKTVDLSNHGSITSCIRAIYVQNKFLCDPSTLDSNPTTYVNPKGYLQLTFPAGVLYDEQAAITITTERGMKATETEGFLKNSTQNQPISPKWGFGPLMLNFTEFYYMNYSDWRLDGHFDQSRWAPGWNVKKAQQTQAVVWNITVENIDDEDVTLSRFSCLTLIPNDKSSNTRIPWYIQPPIGTYQTIPAGKKVNILYVWATSDLAETPQNNYSPGSHKVILTFFGSFTLNGQSVRPYGQTIPFEAVMVTG